MATTAVEATTPPGDDGALAGLRRIFPWRPVVLPWLAARLLLVPLLVLPDGGPTPGRLLSMDGQWFRLIALDWYDRPYADGFWSEYPFFPLFPAIGGALMQVGMPSTIALAGVSWLAALVAYAGAYRLARRHLDPRAAEWSVWFMALAPGAVSMVLGYSDSLFLAGLVWALVWADERRWLLAGMAALVATSSRPNGAIAVLALVVMVVLARAGWRALAAVTAPSAVFLGAWMLFLWEATGDPLVFWSAKDAWDELSLAAFLADPLGEELGLFHVACLLAVAVPYAMRVRRQPAVWAVIVVGIVGPPLVLGIEGLARYLVLAFPVPFAVADVLVPRSRALAVAFLTASATAMGTLAVLVVTRSWVP